MKHKLANLLVRMAARLLLFTIAVAPAVVVRAAEHAAEGKGAAEGESAVVERTDLLDLGAFRLRSSQITDREVVDVQFGLTLVLTADLKSSDFHELERWKNRLRDQAIIAMRTAEAPDYADPQLWRIQRLIMFRIRRMPVADWILGVYVTDFSVDQGETAADLQVLPVTPSPPKPKPAGEGH